MIPRREVPDPVDYNPKEVHTFIGLAMRWAHDVEKAVATLEVAFRLGDPRDLTIRVVDETYDDAHKKTLGRLLKEARKKERIPDRLDTLLDRALQKRNYLIHHFIAAHYQDFTSRVGCREMIDELRDMTRLFIECETELQNHVLPLMNKYGVTSEKLAALRRIRFGDPPAET